MKKLKAFIYEKWNRYLHDPNLDEDPDLNALQYLVDMIGVFKSMKMHDLAQDTAEMLAAKSKEIANK